ncbi:MAG: non-canonical purine NTP pyrophosphatase [Chloroflexota bacterium]
MERKVFLVTSNSGKIQSFNHILKELNIEFEIEMLNAEYPEDKEKETTNWVALQGAKFCAEKYQKPVLVNDTGLYIEALNGFPGVNTKFTLKRIGNAGLIKLMEGIENRKITWVFSLGFCQPGKSPIEFTSSIEGIMPNKQRGTDGFGFDPIFIPKGYNVTFAEDTEIRDSLSPFRETVTNFANVYLKMC